MRSTIYTLILEIITKHFGQEEILAFDVLHPPKPEFGDYSSNIAMVLAKRLKRNPLEIAGELVEVLQKNVLFSRVEVVAPGYINFFLSQRYTTKIIQDIAKENGWKSLLETKEKKRILVEFISSNPTGPIHLGNARGGPAGDTLARVLEVIGHEVWREFYVNDYGKQIKVLGHSILKDEEAQYRGEYIDILARKKPRDLRDAFEVGMWAAGEILAMHIKPTCKHLDIRFDQFFSERSLHESGQVDAMLEMLREKGMVYKKEDALWYRSTDLGDDKDRVIVRSDGNPTYRLADFAYHKEKFDRGFDRLITFLGADHLGEAREMKAFIEQVLEKKGAYDTVLTQFVRVMRGGKEVKMSKRNGTYYAMDDLIEEVGKDAVRFIFLSYTSSSHITFDIDKAKEQSEKNPVYYVQYAHARIASILKKAGSEFEGEVDLSLLTEAKERELIMMILRYTDIVEMVAQTYETHRLPHYARELADAFHSFYAACRVIDGEDRERSKARLELARASQRTLAHALSLCGVSAPEKM